eukprot:7632268-Alexandrium_andersonii.AAC.1
MVAVGWVVAGASGRGRCDTAVRAARACGARVAACSEEASESGRAGGMEVVLAVVVLVLAGGCG